VAHPRVDAIVGEARAAIDAATTSADLEQVRVRYLGRQGALTQLLRSLGTLAAEERPLVGAAANVVVANQATQAGHRIGFFEFMRYGVVVTLTSLLIATVYVWLIYLR
jgi:phenylalanyl-tRNA synthetase alpha subunit